MKPANIIFILLFTVVLSCNQKETTINSKLLLRSPFGCTHIIEIQSNGEYKITAGYERNYMESFTNFEEIIKEDNFKINNPNDLDSINNLILFLTDKDIIKTKRAKDVLHYELYINTEKKVDAYARKSEEINLLRDIITRHYPFTVDYFCNSYDK